MNIHYHRYAGDYEGWNIWSWVGTGEGASFEFGSTDDFGAIASYTLDVDDGVNQTGFIVRHSTDSNAWDKKDTPNDRFIDLTKAVDGVVDVYVVQDDEIFGYGEDEMNIAPKLMSASLTSTKSLEFSVTSAFDSIAKNIASRIKVTDATGKQYKVEGITSNEGKKATKATISFSEELPLLGQYTLQLKGYGEITVAKSKVFSTKDFEDAFYYDDTDLGAVWSKEKTTFRLWAPTASSVVLNLYEKGVGVNSLGSIPLKQDVKGTWYTEKSGDLNHVYYTYTVTVDGVAQEAVDPYAKAAGVNGERGMIIDLKSTDPADFDEEGKPEFVQPTDAIIYELHIRDFSVDANSGMKNKGKYLAFTEKGTTTPTGVKTGIDHLVDLGITHVHLLPSFDFASINEATLINNDFNWGYDPENYNVPEGSYSTDPQKGEVRINEYKQMVQALHQSGIRVVMDVVYNHTFSADSNLNKIVPGYYYRMTEDGQFANASGCGNEIASERAMVRKFIVDSVVYWATEYHIDGFRFDLMGIHDIETMNAIRKALNEVDPTILIYGEGWTAGSSPLPESERALKANMSALDTGIAAFSDDLRDGIKGSVFEELEKGFVTGQPGMEESIKFGIVASTEHSQIDYTKVNYSDKAWAKAPTQTISYASAHDNLTLWDKIATSNASDSVETRTKMNLLSGALVLTSQGIPFFQAGEEILRSKPIDETGTSFDENSYKSSDAVNSIKWDTKEKNSEVYKYYKGLIAFRKQHSALRMTTTEELQKNLTFLEGLPANVVGYTIDHSPNNESAESICIVFNANNAATPVTVPEGSWNVYARGDQAGTEIIETINGGNITIDPISALVLVKEDKVKEVSKDTNASEAGTSDKSADEEKSNNLRNILIGIGGAIVAITAVVMIILRRRKK
ncbi:MAG: pullulanase [Firmicutes bacterium]|nr:pullulanase [Bacillota bacterium]